MFRTFFHDFFVGMEIVIGIVVAKCQALWTPFAISIDGIYDWVLRDEGNIPCWFDSYKCWIKSMHNGWWDQANPNMVHHMITKMEA